MSLSQAERSKDNILGYGRAEQLMICILKEEPDPLSDLPVTASSCLYLSSSSASKIQDNTHDAEDKANSPHHLNE